VLNPFKLTLIAIIAVPFALWFYNIGNPIEYLDPGVPPGQLLYIFSKLAGLIGITLIGLQLALVFLRKHSRSRGLKWTNHSHRLLGTILFLTVAFHVGFFVGAASLRSGHFAIGPLTLRFSQGFYDQMISLGALAFYLMVLVVTFGFVLFRKKRSNKLRRLHTITVLVVTALAMVHSFSVGSETRSLPMIIFYLLLISVLFYGVWGAIKSSAKN